MTEAKPFSRGTVSVCPKCGSDDIGIDALCYWNADSGEWDASLSDADAACHECGWEGERTVLNWKPYTDQEKLEIKTGDEIFIGAIVDDVINDPDGHTKLVLDLYMGDHNCTTVDQHAIDIIKVVKPDTEV